MRLAHVMCSLVDVLCLTALAESEAKTPSHETLVTAEIVDVIHDDALKESCLLLVRIRNQTDKTLSIHGWQREEKHPPSVGKVFVAPIRIGWQVNGKTISAISMLTMSVHLDPYEQVTIGILSLVPKTDEVYSVSVSQSALYHGDNDERVKSFETSPIRIEVKGSRVSILDSITRESAIPAKAVPGGHPKAATDAKRE